MIRIIGVFFMMGVVLIGCHQNDPLIVDDNLPQIRTMTASETEVISASNDFSFDVFQKVNEANVGENVFISPFSVSTALSMTLNGAKGETANAIRETIGMEELSIGQVNDAYTGLMEYLPLVDKKVKLQVANSNWYRENLTINQEFKQTLLQFYEAEVIGADFADPATVGKINTWISDKTNGLINEMLDNVPAEAVMYLINAIYFKADWKYTFDAGRTAKATFNTSNGNVQVDMMYSKGSKLGYYYGSDYFYIDIPYGNGQYSMSVFMANEAANIDQMIAGLNASEFSQTVSHAQETTAELYFPKFKMDFKQPLNEILTDLGMGIAFTEGQADLSGLFEDNLDLFVSRVLHQSFIEVNEKGTEAAAATVVEVGTTSAGPPVVVRVDRPFAYFIREKNSNTILFAGKMLKPEY